MGGWNNHVRDTMHWDGTLKALKFDGLLDSSLITTSLTAGSILFSNGTGIAQDNANLFWDDTNNRLGVTTAVPTHSITISSSGTGQTIYNTSDQTTNYERIIFNYTSNVARIFSDTGGSGTLRVLRIGNQEAAGSGSFILFDGTNRKIQFYAYGNTTTPAASNTGSPANSFDFFTANCTATSGTQVAMKISTTLNESSGTAANTDLLINRTQTAVGSGIQRLIDAQVDATSFFNVDNLGKISVQATNTAVGTTGNQTINKPSGIVNFAAAATTLTVTNSTVTANSIVHCVLRTNDATARIANVATIAGAFSINLTAAATAETSCGFVVIN